MFWESQTHSHPLATCVFWDVPDTLVPSSITLLHGPTTLSPLFTSNVLCSLGRPLLCHTFQRARTSPFSPPLPPLDHSKGCVFLIDGDVYYSPNNTELSVRPEPCPQQTYIFRERSVRLQTFLKPRWWTRAYGWMAFLPMRPSFSGEAFDRLNFFPPIEQISSGYRLHADLIQSWQRLENKLLWATAFIARKYPAAALRPPPPSVFGYTQIYRSPRAARAQAHASRDWFVMWMGLMSYHIASSPSPRLTPHAIPGWVDELISQDFPQSWVSGVFSSTVATFSPNVPRVGIFVDPLDPPDKYGSAPPSIDWYCQFHVPVWYPWTSKHADEARRTDCIARLAPPPHVLQSGTTFYYHGGRYLQMTTNVLLMSTLQYVDRAYGLPNPQYHDNWRTHC